jgi:hypothetical protein
LAASSSPQLSAQLLQLYPALAVDLPQGTQIFSEGSACRQFPLVLEGNARYWGLVGLVPLLTGTFRFCPAYTLIGVNTCPMQKGEG